MISLRGVRQKIREVLLNSGVVTADIIAFEGRQFDYNNLDLWLQEKVLIIDNVALDDCPKEALTIIVNYNVFYKRGFGTETLEDKAVEICNAFTVGSNIQIGLFTATVTKIVTQSIQSDDDFNFIPCQIYLSII